MLTLSWSDGNTLIPVNSSISRKSIPKTKNVGANPSIFFLADEMADITFSRSFSILIDALMASLQEILKLSDTQLAAFAAAFEARLPEFLRNALHQTVSPPLKKARQ